MASIFEELMGVTSTLTESAHPARRTAKKVVTEHKKISTNNIKVESRRIFENDDLDELDQKFAAEPTEENPDEVVLVVDPELPSDEEVPENAAEDMIGDLVYKCPVCGSNYVCDCDATMGEGIEVDENGVPTECPICGDDAEQILIGEISPAESAGEEVGPEPVDPEDSDDEIPEDEEFDEEDPDEDFIEEESLKESLEEDFEDDDEVLEEPAMVLNTPEPPVAPPVSEKSPTVEVNNSTVTLMLDDSKFESLMTQVIKENYKGNPKFKITRCSIRKGKLNLEYFVREGRKVTKGVLVGEGFDKKSRKMTIKFVDKGAFTESFAKTPSFIVECVRIRNAVTPVSVNYNYKVRVNESLYRVSGSVGSKKKQVSESSPSNPQFCIGSATWGRESDPLKSTKFEDFYVRYNPTSNRVSVSFYGCMGYSCSWSCKFQDLSTVKSKISDRFSKMTDVKFTWNKDECEKLLDYIESSK